MEGLTPGPPVQCGDPSGLQEKLLKTVEITLAFRRSPSTLWRSFCASGEAPQPSLLSASSITLSPLLKHSGFWEGPPEDATEDVFAAECLTHVNSC